MADKIDRWDPEPVYRQLAAILRGQIERGELAPRQPPRAVAAGLRDPAVQAGGEVDLEPVPRERVVPQHDVAVARGAHIRIAAQAQHSAGLTGEDAYGFLVGMKVEVPDRPGGHLPIGSWAA
jgi:hypothetical protein